MNGPPAPIVVAPAQPTDVAGILSVLDASADDSWVFRRRAADVGRAIADFAVARDPHGRVVGCAALHWSTPTLAELLSVAVLPHLRNRQVGTRLVQYQQRRAHERGARQTWLMTRTPDYFERHGYRPAPHTVVPIRVLGAKLASVFAQPPTRWIPAMAGQETTMVRTASSQDS